MTSLPSRASAGIEAYLPSGRARITMSACSAASRAVTARAPGARICTISSIFPGSPEPAIRTSWPAATARRARTVPTFPAPRMPMVRWILSLTITTQRRRRPGSSPLCPALPYPSLPPSRRFWGVSQRHSPQTTRLDLPTPWSCGAVGLRVVISQQRGAAGPQGSGSFGADPATTLHPCDMTQLHPCDIWCTSPLHPCRRRATATRHTASQQPSLSSPAVVRTSIQP